MSNARTFCDLISDSMSITATFREMMLVLGQSLFDVPIGFRIGFNDFQKPIRKNFITLSLQMKHDANENHQSARRAPFFDYDFPGHFFHSPSIVYLFRFFDQFEYPRNAPVTMADVTAMITESRSLTSMACAVPPAVAPEMTAVRRAFQMVVERR